MAYTCLGIRDHCNKYEKETMLKKIIPFCAMAVLFACNNQQAEKVKSEKKESDTNQTEKSNSTETTSQVAEETYKVLDNATIDDLNKKVASKRITTAEGVMQLFSPKQEQTEGNYQYVLSQKNLNDNTTEVTLVETGLMDDSMNGVKTVMEISKQADQLQVLTIRQNYKCLDGRGHLEWSSDNCH
jgi:hypothetical protein